MNSNYNTNVGNGQVGIKQFNRGQMSILTRTLLIAGVGFIVVGLLG
jgi:hypothetical protein